ncbi:unnamed protein product [Lymnaea stagnalis]|uniref:Uncharacterized protein n=1 Tax=Lymnaea stagnalis TaxID=6523 RepID=A0AAV2ILW5_LYMST
MVATALPFKSIAMGAGDDRYSSEAAAGLIEGSGMDRHGDLLNILLLLQNLEDALTEQQGRRLEEHSIGLENNDKGNAVIWNPQSKRFFGMSGLDNVDSILSILEKHNKENHGTRINKARMLHAG